MAGTLAVSIKNAAEGNSTLGRNGFENAGSKRYSFKGLSYNRLRFYPINHHAD